MRVSDAEEVVLSLEGAGGGSKKQKPPVEAPNTLQSNSRTKILELIGFGPILGPVNGLKSIFLNGTPIENEDGTKNFQGVSVQFREGYPDQDVIEGFKAVEAAYDVGAEVKFDTPVIRTLENPLADAALVTIQIPALVTQDSKGNTNPTNVSVHVDWRVDGGPWRTSVNDTIKGKNTSPYRKTYRINFDRTQGRIDLRVRRTTPDSDKQSLQNKTFWVHYTEVLDRKLSYPDMALMAIEVNAEEFGNQMPERTYDMLLSIIKVPSNYDPISRTYTGIWDGQFKESWTDNPAWAFYDLATHPVIGADIQGVDKWALYDIGRYCDELVPDGRGGMEARFSINTLFADEQDAMSALATLASVFRGMAYWGSDTVVPVADKPMDAVKLVTPANVVGGKFSYSGTSIQERHSVAIVMFNDPENNFESTPVVYEDPESVALFGWRDVRVTAVGCTSRGQAMRLAKWILYSERMETETLTYTAATDHADLRPGDIIQVADPNKAGARLGGRVLATGVKTLDLDGELPDMSVGTWYLSVTMPNGTIERREVQSVSGAQVTLSTSLSSEPVLGAVWVLSSSNLNIPEFRVVSVSEDGINYAVTATEWNRNKYSEVELGLKLPDTPTSLIPTGQIAPPLSISAVVEKYLAGGAEHQKLVISIEDGKDPRVLEHIYEVWGPNDVDWRTAFAGAALSCEILDAEAGEWRIRVCSSNTLGLRSQWLSTIVNAAQLLIPPPPDMVHVSMTTFTATLVPVSSYQATYEFWRSLAPLQDGQIETNATRVGVGTTHVDTGLSPDTLYYYYVRAVNAYGYSSWYAVQGQTENDPEEILKVIVGEITETQLHQDLISEIDKISGVGEGSVTERLEGVRDEVGGRVDDLSDQVDQRIQDLDTSVGDQLDDFSEGVDQTVTDLLDDVSVRLDNLHRDLSSDIEAGDTALGIRVDDVELDVVEKVGAARAVLEGQILNLQSQVTDLIGAPDWSPDGPYSKGQLVKEGGSLYRAEQEVPAGTPVSNADYWLKVGDYDSIGEMVSALSVQVTELETSFGSLSDEVGEQGEIQRASVSSLDVMRASIRPERADGEKADSLKGWDTTAQLVEQVRVSASTEEASVERDTLLSAEMANTVAQMVEVERVVATETSALSNRVSVLTARTNQGLASVTNDVSALVDETGAIAEELYTLGTEVEGNTAAIAQESVARSTGDEALAGRTLAIESRLPQGDEGLATAASVLDAVQTAATDRQALAYRTGAIEARLPEGEYSLATEASVTSLEQAFVDETSATNERITNFESAVGDDFSVVRQSISTLVDETESTTEELTLLTSRVRDTETGVTGNADAIEQVGTSVSLIEGQLVSQVDRLDAMRSASRPERADGEKADSLKGWNTQADFAEQVKVSTTAEEASAERTALLAAEVSESSARQLVEEKVRATETSALTQRVLSLKSETGSNLAVLKDSVSTLTTETEAISESVTLLGATVDGNTASIQQVATANQTMYDSVVTMLDELEAGLGEDYTAGMIFLREAMTDGDASLAAESAEIRAIAETSEGKVNTLTQTVADLDSNKQLQINALTGRLTSTEGDVEGNTQAIDSVTTELQRVEGELEASTEALNSIRSSLAPRRADGDKADALEGWRAQADISEQAVTQVRAVEVATERSDELSAELSETKDKLDEEVRDREYQIQALARQTSVMSVEVRKNTATFQREIELLVSEDEALATQVEELLVDVDGAISLIQQVDEASATRDSALGNRTTTIEARMPPGNEGLATSAAVQAVDQASVSRDNALASRTATVEARLPAGAGQLATSAAVEQVSRAIANVDGKVSAAWTVRMNINTRGQRVFAGIGLGIENGPGGLQSQFIIEANRLALLSTRNGVTTSPFLVSGGQVVMNSAVIGNASITAAKIANASIGSAKLAGTIQSDNYSNTAGWRIQRNGSAVFNDVIVRRQLQIASGTFRPGERWVSHNNTFQHKFTTYIDTGMPSSSWRGTGETLLCLIEHSGRVWMPTPLPADRSIIQWGWEGTVVPVSRYSGGGRIFLRVDFYSRWVERLDANTTLTWRLYKVT